MLVSDQSLYSGHRNYHLSTTVNLHHSSSSKPYRKLNELNQLTNINRTTTRSFNFSILTSNATSSYNFSNYIRNNAMNGSINGISAEEVVLYEEGGRKRKVKCEVEVVSLRERRVKSEVVVDADVDLVWNALTDYERLADFIPNLIFSARIPCARPGRIWLEQRGLQRALYWHIEARVVLDLQEFPNSFRLMVVNSTSLWLMEISRNLKANGLSNQGKGHQQQFCRMKLT